MNERIAELMRNHGLHKHISADCQHRIEMLAELIVRECMEVVKWTPSIFPNDEYVKNIKEHFGVEE
jgi:hypothetical protein